MWNFTVPSLLDQKLATKRTIKGYLNFEHMKNEFLYHPKAHMLKITKWICIFWLPSLNEIQWETGGKCLYETDCLWIFSMFWMTNETINIWSHVFGWMLFLGLTLYDLFLLNIHASFTDKFIVGMLLACFQVSSVLIEVGF